MSEFETEPPHRMPVVTEIGFDVLVDNLTYHTNSHYRRRLASQLKNTDATDEESLLTREYLSTWPPPQAAVLASIKWWHKYGKSTEGEQYVQYHEDLLAFLAMTDYSDEPEHDLTKHRLMQKPMLTQLEFERLMDHVGNNYQTSRRLGRAVVHRLQRQG